MACDISSRTTDFRDFMNVARPARDKVCLGNKLLLKVDAVSREETEKERGFINIERYGSIYIKMSTAMTNLIDCSMYYDILFLLHL